MMYLKKIPYYLKSFVLLCIHIKNPWAMIGYFFGRPVILHFDCGIELETTQLLDALIAKETIIDDTYQLQNMHNPISIIDVGGAMGDFSLYAAHLFPKADILVFEPNPRSQPLLLRNIKRNRNKTIRMIPKAVGTAPSITFYIAKYNVRSSIVKDAYSQEEIVVPCVRLGTYIHRDVDLVKIDCEGAELDILASISSSQYRSINTVVLEYHNHLVSHQDDKISQYLKRHHFILQQYPDPFNTSIGYIWGKKNLADRSNSLANNVIL